MPLTHVDAVRILRFCLAADDSGSATVGADGECRVTVALCRSSYEVRTFDGATFEESLRRAGSAGVLKSACIDKQIAFLARRDPGEEAEPVALRADDAPDDAAFPFLVVTDAVHALLHETQRERGLSTLFIASRGRLPGPELLRQRSRVDTQRAVLARVLRDAVELPASVRHRIERANTLLAQLGPTRAGVEDLVMTAAQIIGFYSNVNLELLTALDAYIVTGVTGPQRSGALACVALLYAKEKAGVERAQLTDAFLEDRFSEGQRLSVAALIASQASYLHMFSAAAPRAADQLLRRTMASHEASEVQRMENVVYGAENAGFGVDASTWFAMISRKIDMLGDVSTTVIKMLREKRPGGPT